MSIFNGCTDGNCEVRTGPPLRQHTNGGCRCLRDIPAPLRFAIKRKFVELKQFHDNAVEDLKNVQEEFDRFSLLFFAGYDFDEFNYTEDDI